MAGCISPMQTYLGKIQVGECEICCQIINYHVQLSGSVFNVVSDSLSLILVASFVFLLIRLALSHRSALILSSNTQSKKPVVFSLYYYYVQLCGTLFLLEAIALFLPQGSVAMGVFMNLLLSIQCGVCDNMPIIWAFQKNPFGRKSIYISCGICAVFSISYFIFLSLFNLRFDNCDWCPLFLPTPNIFYFYSVYIFFYLITFLLLIVPSISNRFRFFKVRSSALPWTMFMLSIYSLGNVGLSVYLFSTMDFGYCIMQSAVVIYTFAYAPLLYHYVTSDTDILWQQQILKFGTTDYHPLLNSADDDLQKMIEKLKAEGIEVAMRSEIMLDSVVGTGSYGQVWKATWKGKKCAVKRFYHFETYRQETIDEFSKEAMIMGHLDHPNILKMLGMCVSVDFPSIIFEYMDRGSLFGFLHKKKGSLSNKQRKSILLDVAQGMDHLHRHHPPIWHRDLKSGNILLDKMLRAKICDFGMSKLKELSATMTKLTGTPFWAAPEVLREEKYTEKADVYSFGIVVWECLSMSVPFKGMNPLYVASQIAQAYLRPEIPNDCDEIYQVIMKDCWLVDYTQRPSFKDIVKSLQSLSE